MAERADKQWMVLAGPRVAQIAALWAAAGLTGCGVTIQGKSDGPSVAGLVGGDGAVAAAAPEGNLARSWPDRVPVSSGLKRATLEKSKVRPMGVIQRIEGPLSSARPGEHAAKQLDEELLADGRTLIGRMRGGSREPLVTVTSEGKGAVLYYPIPRTEAHDVAVPVQGKATMFLKFISAVREATPADARVLKVASDQPETPLQPDTLRIQRTWFTFSEPAKVWKDAHPDQPARGMVVILPGMFGTPRELIDETVRRLRNRGWAVLRMLAQPSRFTERVEFTIDAADITASAKKIGAVLQDRAAECAYATHAASLYVLQEYPELAKVPRAVLGMSGGAMVAPTVVARDPGSYDGAVLIAGGGDFLQITMDSNYASWIDAMYFNWNVPSPTARMRQELVEAYRASAPLDSLNTVKSLAGKPVLMIQGDADRAVPSRLGDELWREAGRPERWIISGGHEWVFLTMPYHLNRALDWLEQNLPAAKPAPAPAKAQE